jgi:hypothetical protein
MRRSGPKFRMQFAQINSVRSIELIFGSHFSKSVHVNHSPVPLLQIRSRMKRLNWFILINFCWRIMNFVDEGVGHESVTNSDKCQLRKIIVR